VFENWKVYSIRNAVFGHLEWIIHIWDYIQNGSIWIDQILVSMFGQMTWNRSNKKLQDDSNKALLLTTTASEQETSLTLNNRWVIEIALNLNRECQGVTRTNLSFSQQEESRVCWMSLLYVNMSLICVCLKRICNNDVWWWCFFMFYRHFCAQGRLNGPNDLQR